MSSKYDSNGFLASDHDNNESGNDFMHSLSIDSESEYVDYEMDPINQEDVENQAVFFGDGNFETENQRRFYSEFSDSSPGRYQNFYQNMKRKNINIKKISIIALFLFSSSSEKDEKNIKSPSFNPVHSDYTSEIYVSTTSPESTPTDNLISKPADKITDTPKSDHISDSNKTISNHLKFSDYGSGLYQPRFGSFDFIYHPTDSSIDGLFVTGSFEFSITSLEGGFIHALVTADDMRNALKAAELNPMTSFVSYQISQDWEYILLEIKRTKVFRHSFVSTYFVYSVNNKSLSPLSKTSNDKVMDAQFSPTGHRISFVIANDLYISDLVNEKRITNDGNNGIFNGISDWVYEEEVFSSSKAHWWSPDGSKIIFMQTNDTHVPEFKYNLYNSFESDNSYPEEQSIRYPKAGFPNPTVKLFIHDLNKPDVAPQFLDITETDSIITQVSWITKDDSNAIIKVSNRQQNHFKVHLISKASEGSYSSKISREINSKDSDKSWIDVTRSLLFIPKDSSDSGLEGYLDIVEHNGFSHIALFSPPESDKPIMVTQGQWDVIDGSLYFDQNSKTIYYQATTRASYSKDVFSLSLSKGSSPKNLTSDIITPDGVTGIGSYNLSVSKKGKYAVVSYLGPQVPWKGVYKLDSGSLVEKPVRVISDNDKLRRELDKLDLPTTQIISIPSEEGYADLDVKLTFPPGFNSKRDAYYSVLFNVYGGPNSKMVDESFSMNTWNAIAVSASASRSEHSNAVPLVIVQLDPRGTAHKGRKFSRIVNGNLGIVEARDVVRGAKYLLSNHKYLDPNRVGIWGWSYGGFLTLKTLEADPELFKVGMSVAPVTNWKFYDSIYTERYMNTPQLNPQGYSESAVHNYTSIASTNLLLMHGTGDDNVHIQNSYVFVQNMISVKNHKMTVMVYPDSDHSISLQGAREYLDDTLSSYLFDHFSK
ncbi:Dipeptidyl-aminopeptidase B [Smittium mucronatum]|uniref:Dipeptidyl-aminopeptidase B n=1 Tax=Smittium mucronatum TaxID=133383 RepID=A0A1R0H5P0_9FUNG|nr:Dipeptidyl-aminopeptidase B [Smittium mucronatum]